MNIATFYKEQKDNQQQQKCSLPCTIFGTTMNYGPWKSTAWINRKSDPWIFVCIRLCRRRVNAYSHSVSMGTQNERSFYTVPSDSSYIVLSGFIPKKDNRCSNHNLSCVESIVQTSCKLGWISGYTQTSVWHRHKRHFIFLIFIDVFLCVFNCSWRSVFGPFFFLHLFIK